VTAESLLSLFDEVAVAVCDAVAAIPREQRRDRTDRAGQYALDLVADRAACEVLRRADVRILSEESGVHPGASPVTVVIDPVDGSTNCAREIAYWATSVAAIDEDGLLCSLVVNQATGARTSATRGGGAFRDGIRLRASTTTRVEDSVVSVAAQPTRAIPWKQYRAFACSALALCEVAAGGIDAHADTQWGQCPWDYLGGLLACCEAGAVVIDAHGRPLVTTEPDARRRIVAAGTAELAEVLRREVA
jgi:fructose-1,6-bisphosphatase/inositol monophosphatase family enzyme